MHCSIELSDRIYVKGYIFYHLLKLLVHMQKKVAKSMSKKYSQEPFDSAKNSTIDALEIASKRAIQKTVEGIGDLIGNEIANKITSISKSPI